MEAPSDASSGSNDCWYAFTTRARTEKRVHAYLERRGIESFLPLAPHIRQWHDRKKVVRFPLFPGYVFARCRTTHMARVLETPGVAKVVALSGTPTRIREEEIENIARLTERLPASEELPRVVTFREGEPVEVSAGPLEGVRGVVVESRGGNRVVVGLRSIGTGLQVNVPTDAVKRLTA